MHTAPPIFYEFEIAVYNAVRERHGFFEDIAQRTGGRATAIRQAINPFYLERQSFITRTALVFVAWLAIHPQTAIAALYGFVALVLHYAPRGEVRNQVKLLEGHVAKVKTGIDAVQNAIDEIPQVRMECREYVKKRKARKAKKKK